MRHNEQFFKWMEDPRFDRSPYIGKVAKVIDIDIFTYDQDLPFLQDFWLFITGRKPPLMSEVKVVVKSYDEQKFYVGDAVVDNNGNRYYVEYVSRNLHEIGLIAILDPSISVVVSWNEDITELQNTGISFLKENNN